MVERQLGGHLMVAAVAVGDEAARALVGPFDRAAERARRVQDAEIFGIGRLLHAERTADAVGQDAHLVAPDAEHLGDVVAEAEHPLAADMQGPMAALGVVIGDRRARLHRVDDDAVVAQFEAGDVGRAGKGGGDLVAVAVVEIEPDISRHVVVKKRGGGGRRLARLGHRRQRVDLDDDGFGGVLGGGDGLGDHRGDGLADMPHLAGGERIAGRAQHRRAVAIVHDLARRQRADPARRQIGRGVDRQHVGHRARRRGLDAADHAVGIVAAHHHRIGLARQADIVGVTPFAAQQYRVFGARDRLADREFFVGPKQCRIDGVVHGSPLCGCIVGLLQDIANRPLARRNSG